jgi:hypothetical protein
VPVDSDINLDFEDEGAIDRRRGACGHDEIASRTTAGRFGPLAHTCRTRSERWLAESELSTLEVPAYPSGRSRVEPLTISVVRLLMAWYPLAANPDHVLCVLAELGEVKTDAWRAWHARPASRADLGSGEFPAMRERTESDG